MIYRDDGGRAAAERMRAEAAKRMVARRRTLRAFFLDEYDLPRGWLLLVLLVAAVACVIAVVVVVSAPSDAYLECRDTCWDRGLDIDHEQDGTCVCDATEPAFRLVTP